MSIKLISTVRDRILGSSSKKVIAFLLADHAKDDGTRIFPKVETLADDAELSKRTTQAILVDFRKRNILVLVKEACGHWPREYRIDPEVLEQLPLTNAAKTRRARKLGRQTAARDAAECVSIPNKIAAECTPSVAAGCTPIETIQGTVQSIDSDESIDRACDANAGVEEVFAPMGPAGSASNCEREAVFNDFWQAYPRKVSKPRARKAWAKAITKATPKLIIDGALRYGYEQAQTDPHFIKHPATWLNDECWLDEPAGQRPGANGQGPASSIEAIARAIGIDPDAVARS